MTESTNPKSINRWKMLFVISLGLNLLIIGALGGILIRKGNAPMVHHLASGRLYMQALEFRDKKALRNEILGDKDGRELVKAQNYASFRSAVDILKKHPFDRSALENLLDEQAKFTQSRRGSARGFLIAYIERMTKEKRENYALRLEDLVESKGN